MTSKTFQLIAVLLAGVYIGFTSGYQISGTQQKYWLRYIYGGSYDSQFVIHTSEGPVVQAGRCFAPEEDALLIDLVK